MPWHAVEGPVQAEPLPHASHRAAEDFHVAARVVAADALLINPQAGNEVVQQATGSPPHSPCNEGRSNGSLGATAASRALATANSPWPRASAFPKRLARALHVSRLPGTDD